MKSVQKERRDGWYGFLFQGVRLLADSQEGVYLSNFFLSLGYGKGESVFFSPFLRAMEFPTTIYCRDRAEPQFPNLPFLRGSNLSGVLYEKR
ncbi:MAG: hypothetical protein N2Z76_04180 [Treponemataceae bacterium]|nr:hypothetical protein [Treponemataceae bacterium]